MTPAASLASDELVVREQLDRRLLLCVGEEPVGEVEQPEVDRGGVGVDVVHAEVLGVEDELRGLNPCAAPRPVGVGRARGLSAHGEAVVAEGR